MEIRHMNEPTSCSFSDLAVGEMFRNASQQGLFVKVRATGPMAVVIQPIKSGTAVKPGETSPWDPNDRVFPVRRIDVYLTSHGDL